MLLAANDKANRGYIKRFHIVKIDDFIFQNLASISFIICRK